MRREAEGCAERRPKAPLDDFLTRMREEQGRYGCRTGFYGLVIFGPFFFEKYLGSPQQADSRRAAEGWAGFGE